MDWTNHLHEPLDRTENCHPVVIHRPERGLSFYRRTNAHESFLYRVKDQGSQQGPPSKPSSCRRGQV